jgi:hypothetical protein
MGLLFGSSLRLQRTNRFAIAPYSLNTKSKTAA